MLAYVPLVFSPVVPAFGSYYRPRVRSCRPEEGSAMLRLDGKVAIVSGAARGAGAVIARVLAEEGAKVVLVDVKDDLGEKTAADIGDQATYVHCDITREDHWERAVATCVGRFGKLTT